MATPSQAAGLSLGARLAQTSRAEAENTRELAEARARQASAEELRNFQLVERFFADAKDYFTQGILAGTPTAKLTIMVGREYAGQSANTDVEQLICGYNSSNTPQVLDPKHKYHSLWREFEAWCIQNELKPAWTYEWDGGGMTSWYRLRIAPLQGAAGVQGAISNPGDVRRQHEYCLSVLATMTDGFVQAMALLDKQGKGAAKSKLAPLLISAKQLQTLLHSDNGSLAA